MGDQKNPSARTAQEHFPGKRLTRVFNGHQAPVKLSAVVAYCRLGYLDAHGKGHGKGTTYQELEQATGLDRQEAARSAVTQLQEHGLAVKRGKRWYGLAPAGETAAWFDSLPGAQPDPWYKRYAYYWMPTRSRSGREQLSLAQVAVLAKIVNLWLENPRRRQTVTGLAELINLTRKTVGTSLARLRELGLIDTQHRPLPLNADQLAWFVDKKKKPAKRRLTGADLCTWSGPNAVELDLLMERMVSDLRAAGYSDRRIQDYWTYAMAVDKSEYHRAVVKLVRAFAKMFARVELDHAANRSQGKVKAATSYGLLKFETRRFLAKKKK